MRPHDNPAETLERIVSKRRIHVEPGDVLILRERTPLLNLFALATDLRAASAERTKVYQAIGDAVEAAHRLRTNGERK